MLLLAVVAAIAQLAGVSTRGAPPASRLVFTGLHERWLVQAPGRSGKQIEQAARRLGGGKAGRQLPGGWYEVRLGQDVAAVDAEAAFAGAGARAIEPVLPRVPYDEPQAFDDPAPPPASGEPEAVDDPPAAFGDAGGELRAGPLSATRLAEQWALSQASDQDIDAPEAWQVGTGAGAVVAVIDTGVDASHPDLAGRVLEGRDFSGAGTGATVDRVGHGTQVASIIAANGANIAGVAPDARIMPLKVFRDSAGGFSMSGYLSAIRHAADHGADVINISLGCGGSVSCFSQAELDALTYATERGVVVIAAAGNGDSAGNGMNNDAPATPDFPSGYELPGIVSVTSSSRSGTWSKWSNYGARTVDLAAPGEGILVAAPQGSYRTVSGTSFSAPLAAGAAALVAAARPAATPADIRSSLMGSVVPSATLRTRSASGGILNARGVLDAPDVAGGGAAQATGPVPISPTAGMRVGAPPVMSWTLPSGWSSHRVLLSRGGARFHRSVRPASRALGHPAAAWRSGTYRWQVVARDEAGRLVPGPPRTYRLRPRLGAWVTSGGVRRDGSAVRLRVGYAASEPSARVRVVVKSGRRVVHSGPWVLRRSHVRGVGSPRRAWFAYDARLSRRLQVGQRVTVEVRVRAGGSQLTRRFRARVA